LVCSCNRSEGVNGSAAPARSAQNPPVPSAPHQSDAEVNAAASTATASEFSAVTSGYPSGLRLESGLLVFCDSRGGRALDLASGAESARERACPGIDEERNRACADIEAIAAVREPGADDIIDFKQSPSVPVQGHIRDCAYSAGALLVASGEQVVMIDVKSRSSRVEHRGGAAQVAINDTWLAWSSGKKVFAQRR